MSKIEKERTHAEEIERLFHELKNDPRNRFLTDQYITDKLNDFYPIYASLSKEKRDLKYYWFKKDLFNESIQRRPKVVSQRFSEDYHTPLPPLSKRESLTIVKEEFGKNWRFFLLCVASFSFCNSWELLARAQSLPRDYATLDAIKWCINPFFIAWMTVLIARVRTQTSEAIRQRKIERRPRL